MTEAGETPALHRSCLSQRALGRYITYVPLSLAMKIILAPDSFKGSLSAQDACRFMAEGVRRVFPEAILESIPLADGGEGTLDALLEAAGGARREIPVQGPDGREVAAAWGILPDGRAVVEMAQASGLTLVPATQRDAETASTFGTGELIKAAIAAGCREIIVGVGGSATSDGGTGALTALGAHFRDRHKVVLPPGGSALRDLGTIDLRFMDPRVQKCRFTVLCDVTNPLTGPQGAAHVFAPQKGADPGAVERLEEGLSQLAKIARKAHKIKTDTAPGAGAAGGLAYGLMAFCDASLQSGIEVVLKSAGFAARVHDADWVLTGEGALDSQTLGGKTIAGVTEATGKYSRAKVLAFGGMVRLNGEAMDHLGIRSAFSIADGPRSLEECLTNAGPLLANAVERALRLCRTP